MESLNIIEIGAKVGLYFVPFLFALCFHEFAHAFVAKLRGDRTAEMMGRLSMNPLVHMDMVGTLLLPLGAIFMGLPFFGWAKPVPVNPKNFKDIKNDMFWVALAGPLSNVLLAIVAVVAISLFRGALSGFSFAIAAESILRVFLIINLFLAFFNMLPFHPLDGGKVFARFLPYEWNKKLEDNQHVLSMVLIGLFIFGGLRYLAIPVYAINDLLLSFV
ncbi:MAG: site-2 protease family protein [Bdellovibrionaceae bacterium]|jgi:Zn-dependent protease|nr:site-2 protease family protein [Pseudobdellovibrionaceae bacterium]